MIPRREAWLETTRLRNLVAPNPLTSCAQMVAKLARQDLNVASRQRPYSSCGKDDFSLLVDGGCVLALLTI
jgi:hypothetical protein